MPLFAGEEHLERDAIFWHFPHYLVGRQTPASAVRMGDWKLIETFETGLRKTVAWYLGNRAWSDAVSGGYSRERQGLKSVK